MISTSAIAVREARSDHAPRIRLVLALLAAGLLHACAWQWPMGYYSRPPLPDTEFDSEPESIREIERNRFVVGKDNTLIGRLVATRTRAGDTLPDIARHYGLGHEEIGAANPGVDMWAPEEGGRVLLPLRFVLPDSSRKGIVINLAAMRLFYFPGKAGNVVATYPVGIGKEGRSTPTGDMQVVRKQPNPTWYVPESIRRDHAKKGDPLPAAVPPGPDNPLGEYAMYLSKPSYLIHGTDKPYSIGIRASNGCLRLYPENIDDLYKATPVHTPVRIVNQPYLLGWHKGYLYLEAHEPHEELNTKGLQKALYAKLAEIEKQGGRRLDWPKIKATVAEARGVPVPVFERTPSLEQVVQRVVELPAPAQLYGRPVPPSQDQDGWYVKALETDSELNARRAAAVLNHLGPQIPARVVLLDNGNFLVRAGPFEDAKSAQKAARQMRADLDFQSEVLPPAEQRLSSKWPGEEGGASEPAGQRALFR
jgi:L,D-transpeptidase ErfK/SrfK